MNGLIAALFGESHLPPNEIFRTRISAYHFAFEFARQPTGKIRIYINEQPHYAGRSHDLQSTHRYFENGRYYICIRDHLEPVNVVEARDWATYWASQTVHYIQCGRLFA
jgi:hypothetical protein